MAAIAIAQVVTVPQTVLEQLQATVKIDVTPKSVYDRFAQEQTIENLLLQGLLTAQRVSELRVYAELLDDDSVAPKQKILEAVEMIEEKQRQIAMIQMQGQLMQQRAAQFIMGDPEMQASQMADIMQAEEELKAQEDELEEEVDEDYEVIEDNPDDN